jgi:hypothetical protein
MDSPKMLLGKLEGIILVSCLVARRPRLRLAALPQPAAAALS